MRDKQNSARQSLPYTIVCTLTGLAGLGLNITSAYLTKSDTVLSVLVLASMTMIATGYVPAVKKWQGAKWATRIMHCAAFSYVAYVFCVIDSEISTGRP